MAGELTGPSTSGQANIVYILYLVGVVVPLTPLIVVVMAFCDRPAAESRVESHHTFQIRTFWLSWLYGLAATLLCIVVMGFLLIPLVLARYIVRCVKGLDAGSKGEPIAEHRSWSFG